MKLCVLCALGASTLFGQPATPSPYATQPLPQSIPMVALSTLNGSAAIGTTVNYFVFGIIASGTNTDESLEGYQLLAHGQLPAASGVLYTSPANKTTFLGLILLSNTSSAGVAVTLSIGGSGTPNVILPSQTVLGNTYITVESSSIELPLLSGTTLQGYAGTSGVVSYSIFGEAAQAQDPPRGAAPVISYQLLAQGQLGTSNAILYTAPGHTKTLATLIVLANTGASPVAVTLGLNGNSAADQILPAVVIPENTALSFGGVQPPGIAAGTVTPILNPSNYTFTQTPGVTLVGGAGPQAIPMNPCPQGIATTGLTATAVYLSGGTGTAEWKRVSGGTCHSGASGTVIVSPTNSHSGSWTIQSATGGIDLACASHAVVAPASGGSYVVPQGDIDIYGTLRPAQACTVDGLGRPSPNGPTGAATLHMRTAGIPLIDITAYAVTVKNLALAYGSYSAYTVGGVPATAGSVCIQSGVTVAIDTPMVENVVCHNFYNNQISENGGIFDRHFWSLAAVGDGIILGPGLGSGVINSSFSQQSGGNGWVFNQQAALQITALTCYNNQGFGMVFNSGAAFQMDNVDCESDYAGELQINGTAGVGSMQNFIFQGAGNSPTWGTNTTAPAITTGSIDMTGINLVNGLVLGSQGNGLELAGSRFLLGAVQILYSGLGGVVGHQYCIQSSGLEQKLNQIFCSDPSTFSGLINTVTSSHLEGHSTLPMVEFTSTSLRNTFCENTLVNSGAGVALSWQAGATVGARCSNSIYGAISGSPVDDVAYPTFYTIPIDPLPTPTALTISSNTIVPTLPVHTVSAGTLSTITPPTAGGTYCIDLIAAGAFTTDNAGNIASPPLTATVGQIYRTCYNGNAGAWYLK